MSARRNAKTPISKINEIKLNLRRTEGELNYSLEIFGDELAKREKFRAVDGIDALHLYLIKKYGWLPGDVKSLSFDDLRFVLSEEMHGWTLPDNAIE